MPPDTPRRAQKIFGPASHLSWQNPGSAPVHESLSFEEHLKTISAKTNKTQYLLRKIQNLLPKPALITLYKSFVRPCLGYGYIIYEQASLIRLFMKNLSLTSKTLA